MLKKLNISYKLYVHVKSFYNNYLLRDLKYLFLFLRKNRIKYLNKKIIFLPSKIKKFSVVRSPFVSKLSKEQFEIKIYKVLIILNLENIFYIKFFRENQLIKLNFNYIYYKFSFFYNI